MFSGDRLAELREDKHITQKELAAVIGVHMNTLGSYEQNRATPPTNKIIKLAQYFNVSMDYLCCLTDEQMTYDRSRYVALPENCTPEMREDIKAFIEFTCRKNPKK